MNIQVDRTSTCAADDALLATGRVLSINSDDNLTTLINKLKSHPDFALIAPQNKETIEVWHLQVEGQKIATTTAKNAQLNITVLDSRSLDKIFSHTQELYLKRDLNAINTYEYELSQEREKARIQKAINRNRKNKN